MSLTEDVQQKPLWFKLKKNKKQKQESLNYGQVFFCFVFTYIDRFCYSIFRALDSIWRNAWSASNPDL